MSIATQADRVLGWLRERRRPVVSLLRRGLTDEALRALASQLDWALPSEVIELFRWRNGTQKPPDCILDDLWFFPGNYLMSLEESLAKRRGYVSDALWRPRWLPLFTNDGGDFLLLDCEQGPYQEHPVIFFLKGEPQVWTAYDSLSTMLETISAGFEGGVIFVDEAGFLQMDRQRYTTIAKGMNSRSTLWRDPGLRPD